MVSTKIKTTYKCSSIAKDKYSSPSRDDCSFPGKTESRLIFRNNDKELLRAWYPCTMNPYSVPVFKRFSTLADVRELESDIQLPPAAYRPNFVRKQMANKNSPNSVSHVRTNILSNRSQHLLKRPATTISTGCFHYDRKNLNCEHDLKKEIVGNQGDFNPLIRCLDYQNTRLLNDKPPRRKHTGRPVFSFVPQGLKYHCPEAVVRFDKFSDQEVVSENASVIEDGQSVRHCASRMTLTETAILKKPDVKAKATLCHLVRTASRASKVSSEVVLTPVLLDRPQTAASTSTLSIASSLRPSSVTSKASETLEEEQDKTDSLLAKLDNEKYVRNKIQMDCIEETANDVNINGSPNSCNVCTEATQTDDSWEPEIFDTYEDSRMHYGWEMEMPSDPYNIKKRYLHERIPYSVEVPEPDVLPLEPAMFKTHKDVFFHSTVPPFVYSFTVHPKFKSETFNTQREELIRRGKWQYSYKNFSFIY